ncbi:MAG: LuxR family transcriptional regulator [Chlorobium limicola]|uniref:helix-turn-helix transcriptional regulator n=1 Tax=Chlorobium limicola TaxID=1092 RepID=UPI0023EFA714|nr:LuxR family transcriptional regulator [Chlorobium limicola]NTV21778.1 LuxR family transcriptional regulator [Chlorobium limicola]
MKKQQRHAAQQCPVSHLPVRTQPHWTVFHEHADYTVTFEVIGTDILHGQAIADHETVLDYMDNDLFQAVCDDLDLTGRDVFVMINLNPIRKIALSYKRDFANLVYNWGPLFSVLIVYNVHPEILPIIEGFASICPCNTRMEIADSYRNALLRITSHKKRSELSALPENTAGDREDYQKKAFLCTLARMLWIDMLDYPVPVLNRDDSRYAYFLALEAFRKDLLAKEQEHQEKIGTLKRSADHEYEQHQIHLNAEIDLRKKNADGFSRIIEELKQIIAAKDAELAGISSIIEEKTGKLSRICEQISQATISPEQKNAMISDCRNMIAADAAEQQIRMELTDTDTAFLALLQEKHPGLSEKELRISLLIKLNYDTREIARMSGLTKRGMETTRYRMHKKLGLEKHHSMKYYFSSLAENPPGNRP